MREIKGNQVMTQDEGCALGHCIKPRQCRAQIATAVNQRFACIPPDRGKTVNALILDADFQIDGQATGLEGFPGGQARIRSHRFPAHMPWPLCSLAPFSFIGQSALDCWRGVD